MKILTLTMSLLLVTSLANADLLNLSTEKTSQPIQGIEISKSATTQIEGKDALLTTLGAGLRQKKVFVMNVNVYVGALFSDDASKVVRDESKFLDSLDSTQTAAFRMTFLRSVTSDQLMVAFRDAFNANNVKIEGSVQELLNAVSSANSVNTNESITFVMHKNQDGSEFVEFENATRGVTTIKGNKGLSKSVLSLWLGAPADAGVAALKSQIVKGF